MPGDRIQIPTEACRLDLYPAPPDMSYPSPPAIEYRHRGTHTLPGLNELAFPHFWSTSEVSEAFRAANQIWIREANIEFSPITYSERSTQAPNDRYRMLTFFENFHLRPRRGIAVFFVYDYPRITLFEAGTAAHGGRIVLISGETGRSHAGVVVAHEMGHLLISNDHSNRANNLMFFEGTSGGSATRRLTTDQVNRARRTARALSVV